MVINKLSALLLVAFIIKTVGISHAQSHIIIDKPIAYKNLVTYNWKGINWEPYNDDWSSDGTTTDGQQIAACGIRWARLVVNAADSFGKVDKMIKQCKLNNIRILLCYNKSFPARDFIKNNEQATFEINKLKAFVQRYHKNVHYWEIQNEPNLKDYWNIGPGVANNSIGQTTSYNTSVHHYVEWLKVSFRLIKLIDPKAVVILGGISNWTMEDFMDRFTIENGYLYCDEVAFHPYAVNERSYPDECIGRLKSFQQKMSKWPQGKDKMPIWITEIGFHTGVINCPGWVSDEATKARYLQETLEKLIKSLYCSRPIFWYVFHEIKASNTYFSLVKKYNDKGAIKTDFLPAYKAFQMMDRSWKYYR